jgi:hypothetical protein
VPFVGEHPEVIRLARPMIEAQIASEKRELGI